MAGGSPPVDPGVLAVPGGLGRTGQAIPAPDLPGSVGGGGDMMTMLSMLGSLGGLGNNPQRQSTGMLSDTLFDQELQRIAMEAQRRRAAMQLLEQQMQGGGLFAPILAGDLQGFQRR